MEMRQCADDEVGAAACLPAAAGAGFSVFVAGAPATTGFTTAPGRIFCTPSTITR